jgi:photosystem I subunit 3|tara:strand:- start:2454 stop:3005 length:552 start_codon:yes stop_codon:yes gene_type:complete
VKRFFLGLLTFAFFNFSVAEYSSADVLVPCKDSKSYNKRATIQVKKLKARLKKYDPASPAYLAIEQRITRTENRFANYANSGLLCGTDGLPHLIVDGRSNHNGEFIVPAIMFLYIAGWIGWVGRCYLQYAATTEKPNEKEIIIDVKAALGFMASGFLWPFAGWKQFSSGKLVASNDTITVSPR